MRVYGGEGTPVPIPNTAVKLTSVENTWLETAWEDRTVPSLQVNMGSSVPSGLPVFSKGFAKARYAPLAQLVEQLTLNQWVHGSSP